MMIFRSLWFCLSCLALVAPVSGADAKGVTYATPEEAAADPDFAIQGEYAGEKKGVQVIALGHHKFRAVTYQGGLPGAGWDRTARTSKEGTWDEVKDAVQGLKRIERQSPTLGAKAPAGADVLFDGTVETFKKHWEPSSKISSDGLLQQGATGKDQYGSFQLHLEFRLPYMPESQGQARGNSGLYLQGRYEVQMLDSFGLEGLDNECGGIYKAAAPLLNMCAPPLTWQTYDVDFTAAKFDDAGKKISNARATVKLNGVVIHDNLELPEGTPGGTVGGESPQGGPLFLQDHGNPVRYRNIWIVAK